MFGLPYGEISCNPNMTDARFKGIAWDLTIVVFDRRTRRIWNGSARPVPGCFVVPIVVQGLVIRLGVDTGVSGIMLYGDRLKKRLVKMRTQGEPTAVTMGRIAGTRVTLPGVQLGGPEEAITVILIKGPEEGITSGLDGYLGVAALHANRIEFDFAKMVLRWQ
jgi:hypothetical protein